MQIRISLPIVAAGTIGDPFERLHGCFEKTRLAEKAEQFFKPAI